LPTVKKLDLRKELKHLYSPSAKQVEIVVVPSFKFLMLDGRIEPGRAPEDSPSFRAAFGALYGMSFTLKFMSKLNKAKPIDYKLMALEGLWWTKSREFRVDRKDDLRWTMMILQPNHITKAMVTEAMQQMKAKEKAKNREPNPALDLLRFEDFKEGTCMQIMHVGPYSEEPRTVERMMAFAGEHGYVRRGKHHEIYLGDPRKSKPERLRTILRQPVKKAS